MTNVEMTGKDNFVHVEEIQSLQPNRLTYADCLAFYDPASLNTNSEWSGEFLLLLPAKKKGKNQASNLLYFLIIWGMLETDRPLVTAVAQCIRKSPLLTLG